MAGLGSAGRGMAGLARQGASRQGGAGPGEARLGEAWQVRSGGAGHGKARRGLVRQAWTEEGDFMNKLKTLQAMWAEAREEHTDEGCGILDWSEYSDPERWWRE